MALPVQDPNLNLTNQFEQDWNLAQQRYRAGVNSGLSDEDAQSLYVNPIRAKWQIVASSPSLQGAGASSRIAALGNDVENSQEQAARDFTQSSASGNDFLNPLSQNAQKWTIESGLPTGARRPLTHADAGTAAGLPKQIINQQVESGSVPINPLTVQKDAQGTPISAGRPFRVSLPPDVSDKVQQGYIALRKAGYDAATAQEMAKQLTLGTNSTLVPDVTTNAPAVPAVPHWYGDSPAIPPVVSTNGFRIQPSGLDPAIVNQITNNPAIEKAFKINSSGTPSIPSPAPANATPKDKVSMAQKISQEHPDWTKDQVILAVQGKLLGATSSQ